jgi:hypothetical protein
MPATRPDARTRFRRLSHWALAILVCFVVISLTGFGSSVQVRLDTGDQWVCQWGIPFNYRPMKSIAREALLSINDGDNTSQWVWCAQQEHTTNHPDLMMYGFYLKASAWVAEDREIARLVVRDLADYLRKTHATSGLPECTPMIWPTIVDSEQNSIREGWKDDPEVQRYLQEKGYVLP